MGNEKKNLTNNTRYCARRRLFLVLKLKGAEGLNVFVINGKRQIFL